MLLRASHRKAWFHWIGMIGGIAILIGSFEQLLANAALEPLFRPMLIAGIVAWMIGLVWLAISLLIGTSGTSKPESHCLVQEREDLLAKRREA
jgi:hypothetical protein